MEKKFFEIDDCVYSIDTTPLIEGATVLTEKEALVLLSLQNPDHTWRFWSYKTGLVRQEEQERDPENNGSNCDEYLLESSEI